MPGDNFNALDISWADGVQVSGFISRKKNRAYSSTGGIRLGRLRNACFTQPIIRDPLKAALAFVEVEGTTGIGMDTIQFVGGVLHRNEYDVITLDPKGSTYRHVHMDGMTVLGGRAAVRAEAPTGAGSYDDVILAFTYANPTDISGGPALTGSNEIQYDVTAPWYGTYGASGKNGSIYRSSNSGTVRIRKGGVWVEDVTIDGVWSPSLTNVINVTSSSTNVCQFMRVGNTVTLSGVVQIKPAAAGAVQVDMSLPVPSKFTGFSQASGTARTDNGDIAGVVNANAAPEKLLLSLMLSASTTNNRNVFFQATYRVLS